MSRGPGRRFLPGVSGNPAGRPRSGTSLAEAIRTIVDPAELAAAVLKIALHSRKESNRLTAAGWLAANGFVRPPELHGVLTANVAPIEAQRVLGLLSTETLRELAEKSAATTKPDTDDTEGGDT